MPPQNKTNHTTSSVIVGKPSLMEIKRQTRTSAAAATTTMPVAQKRRSTSTTKHIPARRHLRGRLGGLKDMPSMPLDILIEIFSLMHPRDLLNLARTSKEFRAFLMSRQSEPFWKAARRRVEGLPECPPFLSEPAYANLVFFPYCHSCLKPKVKPVMWEFLVRYCPKCKNDLVADHASSWPFIDNVERGSGFKDFVNVHQNFSTRNSSYREPHYHWPEMEQFRIKYDRGFTSKAARDEWIVRACEDVKTRKKFADNMRHWVTRQELNRYDELDKLRNARLEAVKQRLSDEGWGHDLDLMFSWEKLEFANIRGVRTSQKLTDRAWATIRKHVVEHMGRVRDRRLARERHDLLSKRFESVSKLVKICEARHVKGHRTAVSDWLPTFADLAAQPGTFRDIINASSDGSVTKEKILGLPKVYPEAARAWLETRKVQLNDAVLQSTSLVIPTPDGVAPHSLAIATWDCTRCSWKGMRWAQLLAHECGRLYWSYSSDPDPEYHRALSTSCFRLKLPRMWTMTPFIFNPVLDRTRVAIEACGEDPDTVTFAQMEACEVRLICRRCMRGKQSCSAFDWKTAAYHGTANEVTAFVEEPAHVPIFWRLDAANASRVREIEAENQQPPESTHMFYGCARCRSSRMNLATVQDHCSREHNIQVMTLDEDYYIHTDRKPYFPEPIRIHSPALEADPGVALEVEGGCGFISPTLPWNS
ncbi:hypothetical protein L226DRAFT_610613 [Lentinus tigrinus ALCF2SS1-7]|uniref:F-box domain-containing protein n=1 Tax=Lentinus tigrinus ALCF2SS1-6 TaxID=1328759 RepID=A0A5C2S264_9APHY|nr:hypothetical protein L227DRAFT_226618 [Lentinus tigrinus ALCF2SS1-6]RPD78775.1 hypothetical protein L226DRAFT_610613 [Lentinus tigrinus ALCF2SS1-7]